MNQMDVEIRYQMLHQQGALFCTEQTLLSIEVTVLMEVRCLEMKCARGVNESGVGSNYRVIFLCIIAELSVSPLIAGRSAAFWWKILKDK